MKINRLLLWIVVLLTIAYLSLKLLFLPAYVSFLSFGSETISITRDSYNIPHIKAETKRGAYYALGFVSAEDRLFQMHLKRMLTQGRLSEMFGEKSLPVDKMFRSVGIGYWAVEAAARFQKQAPEHYQFYQDFTDGVNHYVANASSLPFDFFLLWIEFHPWTVQDCLTINGLLNWGQSTDHGAELIRSFLASNHTRQQIDILLPFKESFFIEPNQVIVNDQQLKKAGFYESAATRNQTHVEFKPEQVASLVDLGINQYIEALQTGASNSWAISGKHTASGKPILANDPHLQTAIPSEWYQFYVEYRNKAGKNFFLKGASIAGSLANLIGRTEYVSWGCTNVYTDTQDLYKQKLDDDRLNYFYDGTWRKLQLRQQQIKVRGGQTINYTVRSTHHGPLMEYIIFSTHLFEVKETLSLAWSAAHSRYSFYQEALDFLELDNYDDFKKALREGLNDAPPINLLFITRDGHIGLQNIGSYPIMNNQAEEAGYVKDGTSSKHAWTGMLRGRDRMFIEDPEKGYIVTANNRLTTSNFRGGRYQSNWMITARAIRIQEIIKRNIDKGHKFTVDDNKIIQLDTVDYFCKKVLPHVITLGTEFRRSFEVFDCNFTSESSEASLYSMFIHKIQKKLKPSDLPIEGTNPFNHFTYKYLLSVTTDDTEELDLLRKALEEARAALSAFYMSDKQESWPWGKLHRDFMEHRPFSRTPLAWFFEKNFPGRGNQNTPNVALMRKLPFGNWDTNHRAGIRMILTYVRGQSQWIIDSGSSQSILSKHYDNQYHLFKADQYLPFETVDAELWDYDL